MKKFTLFLLCAFLLSCSKKEDSIVMPLTVSQFYNYCSTGNNSCGKPLNHEGDYVSIVGYVQALNTFENEGRFQVFDSASITSRRVDINVSANNLLIFIELKSNLDNVNIYNFTRFKIQGKIIGQDLPINGACRRGPHLEISSFGALTVLK